MHLSNIWMQMGGRPGWLFKYLLEHCIYKWFQAYLWCNFVVLISCLCKLFNKLNQIKNIGSYTGVSAQ